MQKNYYQLLQVSPQATAQEIKLAYRKLALKYHPDRNKGNLLTEAVFKEINEAYSVLSNAEKRKFYNASIAVQHLHSAHKRQAPVTAQSILQDAVKLKNAIEKSNVLNINQDIVFHKIQALLSGFNLHLLLLENNPALRQQFIQQVLLCMQPLRLNDALPLMLSLQKVAAKDEEMLQEIHVFYKQKKSEAFWQRYKFLFVFIIALLLCLLIYLL